MAGFQAEAAGHGQLDKAAFLQQAKGGGYGVLIHPAACGGIPGTQCKTAIVRTVVRLSNLNVDGACGRR